jgi:hypothetical protein
MTAVITDEMVEKAARAVRKAMRDHDLHMAWELSVSRAALAAVAPLFAEQFAKRCDDIAKRWRNSHEGAGNAAVAYNNIAAGAEQCAAAIRSKGTTP